MANLYLGNAFSLGMLQASPSGLPLRVRQVGLEEVKSLLQERDYISAVGHPSTAEVLSVLLGVDIFPNRVAIQLVPGDQLVVFQLLVRLPEGAVLTKDEVFALYNEGKALFYIVEVLG
jgi:hypothetical protein